MYVGEKVRINGLNLIVKKGNCFDCKLNHTIVCKKCRLKGGECFKFEKKTLETGQGHEVVKKYPENGEYYRNGFEAVDIMNLITIPEGLSNGQKHSLLNVIKRISRFGKKDDPVKEAKKISEELNHIVNGKYR